MQKIAVIDIGSNSVRLMMMADGKVLYKRLNTTRLGEGIAHKPVLKSEAIERTAQAVCQYYHQAKSEGVQTIAAYATAAVRSAENGQAFTSRVQELCSLQVDVIAGETEAEIGLLGALGNSDGGVIDVGGASTEIVYKKHGKIIYKQSENVGVVRLKDVCGRDINSLQSYCNQAVLAYKKLENKEHFYAIGGTATTLAAWKLNLSVYDSDKVTGTTLSREEMREIALDLLGKSVEEIAAFPCMPKGRADVLAGGAFWLYTIMDKLDIQTLTVSDRDNLEGYAVKKGWL